jgi:hypothetical protein
VLGLIVLAQRTYPDIAEANRIAVLVEFDETFRRMRMIVVAHFAMLGVTTKFPAMMHNDAIVEDSHVSLFDKLLVVIPTR